MIAQETSLDRHFTSAFHFASSHPSASQLSSSVRLQLYATYKVATVGYPTTSRPNVFDFTGRAKWDAWKSLQDQQLDATSAKKEYIRLLGEHTSWTPPATDEQVVAVPPSSETDSSISWSSDDDEAEEEEERERSYERRKVAPKSVPAGSTFAAPFSTLANEWGSSEDREDAEIGPLLSLIKQGQTDKVLKMLDHEQMDPSFHGIDVNRQDQQGLTALHWVTDHGHKELVKALVETMGARLDIQDLQGQTCLHYAAISGHRDIGLYLLSKGADPRVRDEENCMAFELAEGEEFARELER